MTKQANLREIELSDHYLVAEIKVAGLFGRYKYRASPISESDQREGGPPLMLIYGGNGSGKTTILRMLYHLLSPAPNKGHRTALLKVPFDTFSVRLGTGDVVTAERLPGEGLGQMRITVRRRGKIKARATYPSDPNHQRQKLASLSFQELSRQLNLYETVNDLEEFQRGYERGYESATFSDPYTDYLAKLSPQPFMLADDRRIHADEPLNSAASGSKRVAHRLAREREVQAATGLVAELDAAMLRVSEWLRQSILSGAAEGSQSADEIYRQVLSQIGHSDATGDAPTIESVRNRLGELDARTRKFNEFELVPKIAVRPMLGMLNAIPDSSTDIAARILEPYISGQLARLDSLQETESLVRTIVHHLNKYLVDKEVSLTPRSGLRIKTSDGAILTSDMLSSGERQILLLLLNSFLARPRTSLFLIDEPEISLNVRWQRSLVGSLLDVVKGSKVQFIMASHSVEIITQHKQYLARLESL